MMLNQKGFGLVQVMIAIAAVAGISYTMMQNNAVTSKQQSKANFDIIFNDQTEEIQTELANLVNCTATLKGLAFSTSPVALSSIKKGFLTNPEPLEVTPGPNLFTVRKPNSQGIYINGIHFFTRSEQDPLDATKTITNDVIRVQFNSGDVNAAGVARDRAKGLGATQIARDFVIQSTKDATGKVETCFSDNSNTVKNTCDTIPDAVWNPTTKKCDYPNAIPNGDLVDLYTQPDGTLGLAIPPPTRLKVNVPLFGAMDVKKSCQCSGKKCSRAPNPCTCGVPACPTDYVNVGYHNYNRDQSSGFGVDHACMYASYCEFISKPVGKIVKP